MVKTFIKLLYLICTVLIFDNLSAQTSGIVKYQKIVDYGIEPVGKPRWDNYIKNLPKEGKFTYQLRFKGSESVFEGVPSEDSPLDPTVVRALNALPLLAPPKVKIEKIYQNIEQSLSMKIINIIDIGNEKIYEILMILYMIYLISINMS